MGSGGSARAATVTSRALELLHAYEMVALHPPVASALAAYVHFSFRPRAFGLKHLCLDPGTIVASNHRSDNDVPLLASVLYRRWSAAVASGAPWPTFAVDDHLFFRGFLAGYPEGIPLIVRRLLWPVRVGGVLERRLQCIPVRSPARMRLIELLRAGPEQPLDGRLPSDLQLALRRRAAELGRRVPVRSGDVLAGGYADLLWTLLERDDTAGWEEVWRAHLREAVADFRRMVKVLRAGGIVVIFPEGELSADGRIGPLHAGLASLARRGRARRVQPIAISYDPLTYGRSRAYVSVAPAIAPQPGRLSEDVSAALRRAIPLTAGQIAATVLRDHGSPAALEVTARRWVENADAQGRPVEPALRAPGGRMLRTAYARARRRGADDWIVASLARELETAQL
jgi:1-acyl-sn-glycerol-3-phosphate acyltransferase